MSNSESKEQLWKNLAASASTELDPKKLMEFVHELERVLSENDRDACCPSPVEQS
jgi:7,8-dihydro-6-hydroxymethylpterin-pyrophosphokinase